jgi:Holliday junction resolvase RusA-like endonuclease
MNLRFTVYGSPVPQGSMKAVTPKNARFTKLVSDNEKLLKPWRQQVSETAFVALKEQWGAAAQPIEGPVAIVLDFYFDRPKSVKRDHVTVAPDVDKCQRSIFDSLSGVVFRDDALVVDVRARKHYGSPARVEVLVGELT